MSEEDDDIDLLGGSHGDESDSDNGGDTADEPDPDGDTASEPEDAFDMSLTEETDAEPGSGGSRDRMDEPLGDLAERLNREDREALDSDEGVFEEVDTGKVNVEDVWEQLEAGPGPQGESLGESEDVRRISRSVCHNCPHFGEPPELHCTYEGTTIREMPDSEHFVVVECPVVAGEEDI